METFGVQTSTLRESGGSRLNKYSLSLSVKNIGVAFPLSNDKELKHPPAGNNPTAVRAFLFSVNSLVFEAQHSENGQVVMKGFSLQFVRRYDVGAKLHLAFNFVTLFQVLDNLHLLIS